MNKKIGKVLFLSGAPRVSTNLNATSSGARAHVLGVISGFISNGYQVEEFIYGDKLSAKTANSRLYSFKNRPIYKRIIADVYRILYSVINGVKAVRSHYPVDFTYERLGAFQILGYFFKRKGIPWILETNSVLYKEAQSDRKSVYFGRICRWFENFAYTRADLIVAVTDELKEMVIQEFGIVSDRIIVIPNGVDTNRFDPHKNSALIKKDRIVIGFVGNFVPWAGINFLIDAIAIIDADYDFEVLVVGDGMMREEWEKHAEDLGVSNKISFVGRASWGEVPRYIASFDVCYSGQINTFSKGMYHSPLKIYEYLSMGKPVIASAYQDAMNLIEEGVNGYTFKPGSVDEIVSCITNYIKDHGSFQARSSIIRDEVIAKHSWDNRVKTIISSFHERNIIFIK